MNRRNLILLALMAALSSCNMHIRRSLNLDKRDSSYSHESSFTGKLQTDSTDHQQKDSSYLSAVVTAGDSGIDITYPVYHGEPAGITHPMYKGEKPTVTLADRPVSIHLSKGSTVSFQQGHLTDIHEADKHLTDSGSHKQADSGTVETKQKQTNNNSETSIPWFGIAMVALLLWLALWTWKNKVIKI